MRFENPDENSAHTGLRLWTAFSVGRYPEGTVGRMEGRRGMEECGLSLTRTLIERQLKEVVECTTGLIEPTRDPSNTSYRPP